MLVSYHSIRHNEMRKIYLDNDDVLDLTEKYNHSKKAQKQYKNVTEYIKAVCAYNY